jgi:putative PIN family toxin of toxin-antitoxin system
VEGPDQLLISKAIIDELLRVLAEQFSRDREQLARVAVFLADIGEMVRPRERLHVLAGEPDNRILECAIAGKADAIVTGDRALLALDVFQGIRILTLRGYLA